jgi:hypothetical protein
MTESLYGQDRDVYGHHQTHFGWAKGQSWEKEADSTFCTACNDICVHTYGVGGGIVQFLQGPFYSPLSIFHV